MINRMAQKLVQHYISKGKIDQEQSETYIYCFELLLSTIFNLLIVISISIATKLYIEGIVFSVCFMTMRILAGGYHSNTHFGCLTTLLVIFIGYVLLYKLLDTYILFYLSIAMLILSMIIPFLAPVDSVNKQLTISEYRKNKKKTILAYMIFLIADITLLSIKVTQSYAFSIAYPLFIVTTLLVLGFIKNKYDLKNSKLE